MMKDNTKIVKKQILIDRTRKSVIMIVTGASVVIGALIVVCGILIHHLLFNNKVMGEQNQTISVIKDNLDEVPDLRADLKVLNNNKQLMRARSSDDAKALQTVLDALPADQNRLALGASLERKVFKDVPGLTVQSMSVDPRSGIGATQVSTLTDTIGTLQFSASITGPPEALKSALERLESSIRAFNVVSIDGTTSGSSVTFNIVGEAYYLKPVDLELGSKEVTSR